MPVGPLSVEATFNCRYVEIPDTNLNEKTLVLAPVVAFGAGAFDVIALSENEGDELAQATARMSPLTYTLMIRHQQGSESFGDDPPPWALVEGSAKDLNTDRILETGEVFPVFG